MSEINWFNLYDRQPVCKMFKLSDRFPLLFLMSTVSLCTVCLTNGRPLPKQAKAINHLKPERTDNRRFPNIKSVTTRPGRTASLTMYTIYLNWPALIANYKQFMSWSLSNYCFTTVLNHSTYWPTRKTPAFIMYIDKCRGVSIFSIVNIPVYAYHLIIYLLQLYF